MRSASRSRRVALLLAALGVAVAAAVVVAVARSSEAKPKRWTLAASMPNRRSYTASALVDGKIYVAAGMVGGSGKPLNVLERFDPARDAWTTLHPLPAAFSAGAGAALGGRVYVAGGNAPGVSGRQVYSYDPRTDRWRSEPSLPAPRTNLALAALGGRLYAIGGLDPTRPVRTVFALHPGAGAWTRVASLPFPVHALAAIAYRGRLWALGGRDTAQHQLRSVWIYDARRNRWRAGPAMPRRLDLLGATVLDGELHVASEYTHAIYHPESRRWTLGLPLGVPRHALALFTVRDAIYAIGGCIVPQLQDSPLVEVLH